MQRQRLESVTRRVALLHVSLIRRHGLFTGRPHHLSFPLTSRARTAPGVPLHDPDGRREPLSLSTAFLLDRLDLCPNYLFARRGSLPTNYKLDLVRQQKLTCFHWEPSDFLDAKI